MSCNSNIAPFRHGNMHTQRMLSCGFNAGFAKFTCVPKRETAIKSVVEHVYPIKCPEPEVITVERVVKIPGVDNAIFLVSDVNRYRMNKNFVVEIPGEAAPITAGNFPVFLLLKSGDAHTLSFSTGNIEAILRQNAHMFTKDGIVRADISLFPDLAPQDMSVEGADGLCRTEREFKFRIVSNTTLDDASTTLEINIFECGEPIDREIWFIIPVHCENGNKCLGANLLPWDYSPRSCGESVFIGGRSTDCGTFIISGFPRGCHDGFGVSGVGGIPRIGNFSY